MEHGAVLSNFFCIQVLFKKYVNKQRVYDAVSH